MSDIWEKLRNGLIVSCQAEGDDPFNQPQYLALFARAAEMGGASGLRACGAANIQAIRGASTLPIIGLTKSYYADGYVLITADLDDVESVLAAGADIVAVDATSRARPNGLDGGEFVSRIKSKFECVVLADVSTLEEGLRALDAGADAVATTLSGYTPATSKHASDQPDWELLGALATAASAPVIMEGHLWTPDQARQALEGGAFAVVVGTAITRPRVVTRAYVDRMRERA